MKSQTDTDIEMCGRELTVYSPKSEPPAKRSGVPQGCVPSATGSADARAADEAGADSSGRSADPSGPAEVRYGISVERILTVSNHISEDEPDAFTKEEAIEAVKYFQNEFDVLWRKRVTERTALATELMSLAVKTLRMSDEPDAPQRSVERAGLPNDRTERRAPKAGVANSETL